MLQILRSSKVHNLNHIHKPFVNNAFDWLLLVQEPIRGFVYNPACEFQYELFHNKVRNIWGKVM